MGYNFTRLQETARALCNADLLVFLQCCHGWCADYVSIPEFESEDRNVESLAAGLGAVYTHGDHRDFSARLTSDLKSDKGPRSVIERFRRIERPDYPDSPGNHALWGNQACSIVLQPISRA